MKSLDHPFTRLAPGFIVLVSALVLGLLLGQLVVSRAIQQIAARVEAEYLSFLVRRATIASAKAVRAYVAPTKVLQMSPAQSPSHSSSAGEGPEKATEGNPISVGSAPASQNPQSTVPANSLPRPAPPQRSQDLSMMQIACLQILSSVTGLLVAFALLASILCFLQRRWGIRLRLEMGHAPLPASFGRFLVGASGAGLAKGEPPSLRLGSTYDHEQRQRMETEREILTHLCQENLLLHRAIRQQASAA